MTVRWTVRADGDQDAQFASRPNPIRVAIFINNTCGFSSFGRAPPCQGGGGGFEPRNPLQNKRTLLVGVLLFWTGMGRPPTKNPLGSADSLPSAFVSSHFASIRSARPTRNARHRFTKNSSQLFFPRSPRNPSASPQCLLELSSHQSDD